MPDPDDWAPLPAEQRDSHPGELRATAAQQPAPAPGKATPIRMARLPVRAAVTEPDPAAEQALCNLKARIASSKPPSSLIADVMHRERRQERRRRAAKAKDSAAVIPPKAVATPVAPVMEIDTAVADIDPRETEPWFGELPRAEQERLRTHWWHERHRDDDAGVRLRRRLGRALGYGALLFFVMAILLSLLMGSLALVPALTAAGALAAGVAELCGGGRFIYSAAGALAFVAVMGPQVLIQPFSLTSLLIATYGMGSIGMDGEMRRSGGFDAK